MTGFAKVVALTAMPEFIDLYALHGKTSSTFNPTIGEVGFMKVADAITAQGAGDVLMAFGNSAADFNTQRVAAADVPSPRRPPRRPRRETSKGSERVEESAKMPSFKTPMRVELTD